MDGVPPLADERCVRDGALHEWGDGVEGAGEDCTEGGEVRVRGGTEGEVGLG